MLLDTPVRRIVQGRRGVTVESDRAVVHARYCVVTAPPALAARIQYDPILPAARDQLTQRMPMGSVLKFHALYDRPFWRDDGRTGQATSDTGPVKVTYDNSPPTGGAGRAARLHRGRGGPRVGPRARRPSGAPRCSPQFARWFGPRRAAPRAYVEQNWMEEEWSRGCYGAWAPPGVLLDYGPRCAARGPDPLGGHRDRHRVVRLHGRRGALG